MAHHPLLAGAPRVFRDTGREMQKEQRAEAAARLLPRQEEMQGRGNDVATPELQTTLATTIGTVASKLSLLIFLSTFVFAIVVLYFGHAVFKPVAY